MLRRNTTRRQKRQPLWYGFTYMPETSDRLQVMNGLDTAVLEWAVIPAPQVQQCSR